MTACKSAQASFFAGGLRRRKHRAEQHDYLRVHHGDLAFQVRHARRRLVVGRIAVSGRAAFHDVRDARFGPAVERHGGDHPGEQFARASHERHAGGVLVRAGTLADEHQFGVRIAVCKDHIGAGAPEPAFHAGCAFGAQGFPFGHVGRIGGRDALDALRGGGGGLCLGTRRGFSDGGAVEIVQSRFAHGSVGSSLFACFQALNDLVEDVGFSHGAVLFRPLGPMV